MKKVLMFSWLLMSGAGLLGQENTFEENVKRISFCIDSITWAEKGALKSKIKQIMADENSGIISSDSAKIAKQQAAEWHTSRISELVGKEEKKLSQLVEDKVNDVAYSPTKDSTESRRVLLRIGRRNRNKGEKRTVSQFVFAMGLNNMMSDGKMADDQIEVWGSRFYEYGFTWNTRLSNQSNLFHLKYGLSLVYNNLRPKNNQIFESDEQMQTSLVPADYDMDKVRFRNFYLQAPLHFELDFSPTKTKDDKKYFVSHRRFRIGLGGYIGVLINNRQFFKYEENGQKVKYNIKNGYFVNDFTYGLSAYIGYKATSLFVKYDLNPIFSHNAVEQRNVSLGLRFDLN